MEPIIQRQQSILIAKRRNGRWEVVNDDLFEMVLKNVSPNEKKNVFSG